MFVRSMSGLIATLTVITGLPMPLLAAPMPPAVAPALNPAVAPAVVPAGYTLGAGDQIDINVFDTPELSGVRVVAPDGSLALPLVGRMMAAGRTTDGLASDLRERLSTWFKSPIVAVNINQFRSLRINVAGEVRRPGPLQMRNVPHDNTRTAETNIAAATLPTLSTALVAAGGVTRDGDISQVMIKRGDRVRTIDLWQGLTSENAPRDELLQDGDAVYIPKIASGSRIDPRLIAKSTLAPTSVRVRVVGEVKKPGEIDVTPSSTISSAVAIAGGPTDKARMEEVMLVRMGTDGNVTEQKMNLQKLQDTQQVLDGDVVIVPKSRNSNWIDIAGQVISPLGVILNLFRGK
jgi:polysaccharide biosynthesis/export protein